MLPLGEKLVFSAHGSVGYYYYNTLGWEAVSGTGGDFVFGGSAGGTFQLTDSLALGLSVSYDYYSSLYNGLGLNFVTRWNPKSAKQQLFEERSRVSQCIPPKSATIWYKRDECGLFL